MFCFAFWAPLGAADGLVLTCPQKSLPLPLYSSPSIFPFILSFFHYLSLLNSHQNYQVPKCPSPTYPSHCHIPSTFPNSTQPICSNRVSFCLFSLCLQSPITTATSSSDLSFHGSACLGLCSHPIPQPHSFEPWPHHVLWERSPTTESIRARVWISIWPSKDPVPPLVLTMLAHSFCFSELSPLYQICSWKFCSLDPHQNIQSQCCCFSPH